MHLSYLRQNEKLKFCSPIFLLLFLHSFSKLSFPSFESWSVKFIINTQSVLADLFVLWFMLREFPDRLNDQSTLVCKWLLYEQAILDIGCEVDIEGKCDLSKSTVDRLYTSWKQNCRSILYLQRILTLVTIKCWQNIKHLFILTFTGVTTKWLILDKTSAWQLCKWILHWRPIWVLDLLQTEQKNQQLCRYIAFKPKCNG